MGKTTAEQECAHVVKHGIRLLLLGIPPKLINPLTFSAFFDFNYQFAFVFLATDFDFDLQDVKPLSLASTCRKVRVLRPLPGLFKSHCLNQLVA